VDNLRKTYIALIIIMAFLPIAACSSLGPAASSNTTGPSGRDLGCVLSDSNASKFLPSGNGILRVEAFGKQGVSSRSVLTYEATQLFVQFGGCITNGVPSVTNRGVVLRIYFRSGVSKAAVNAVYSQLGESGLFSNVVVL
jgi:hypothetical protein